MRPIIAVKRLVPLLALSSPMWSAARAETQTEIVNETRTYLFFKLSDSAVARSLPAGWTPNIAPGGPFKGANFILVLIDRKLVTDPKGTVLPGGGLSQLAVLVIPGKNASGNSGAVVVGGFSGDPAGAPGAYGAYVRAAATLSKNLQIGAEPLHEEKWSFMTTDGDKLNDPF